MREPTLANRRPRSPWRRRLALALLALGAAAVGLGSRPGPAHASSDRFRGIDVVQVEGLIDPSNAALLRGAIRDAEARGSTLLVVQLDSDGVVDADPIALARAVARARVPIAVWVGPAGAGVRGGASVIAQAAPVLSLASNARIGPLAPLRLDRADRGAVRAPVAPARAAAAARATSQRLAAGDARRHGVVDRVDPVLRSLLQGLDGTTVSTAAGPRTLATLAVDPRTGRRVLNQDLRFDKLSLAGQLQHTLGAPWVAYFLFVVGGALVVFEFFTISIGLAGLVGAGAVVGAAYGFSHLPVRWWALGLLVLALVGFAVDVQAGGLGPWTAIAVVSLVAGSLTLYGGSARLDPPWWTVTLVVATTVLFMVGGMTAMLRSRFATPTVGREGMIGELGVVDLAVAPEGVVTVRGARWRARANRATPVAPGATVRVVAVQGLLLEVEPETGGARDYRDRRPSRGA